MAPTSNPLSADLKLVIVGERGLVSRELYERLSTEFPLMDVVIVPTVRASSENLALHADADLFVLCVQEFASASVVAQLPEGARVLDVSPEYRTNPEWVYGLSELAGQAELIAAAPRVANPGCFASSALLLVEPLRRKGLLTATTPLYLDGVGGYSTGGSKLTAKADAGELHIEAVYGLLTEHRHIDEVKHHARMAGPVWFHPKIVNSARGIRMQVPLVGLDFEEVKRCYNQAYQGTGVLVSEALSPRLAFNAMANKAGATIFVVPERGGCMAICLLDNLGKGAVDSTMSNLRLMLCLN